MFDFHDLFKKETQVKKLEHPTKSNKFKYNRRRELKLSRRKK